MARLLLVHPLLLAENPAEQASASPYFPLGLLSLAAYVRHHGHDVAVYDGTFETDRSSFDERLQAEHPDLVGISALLPTRTAALDFARRARSTGALVVAGGPDPTADAAPYLAQPDVDLVVHHEGERTLVTLLDRLDGGSIDLDDPDVVEELATVPGLAFRRDGRVIVTEAPAAIDDLDELPEPARDLIDLDRYLSHWEETVGYRSMTVSVSRGCPRGCRWCADGVHGNGFRQRSPESVAAEIKDLRARYDIDRLRLVDDVDGMERSWFEAWAALEGDDALPFEALDRLERDDLPMLDAAHPL